MASLGPCSQSHEAAVKTQARGTVSSEALMGDYPLANLLEVLEEFSSLPL